MFPIKGRTVGVLAVAWVLGSAVAITLFPGFAGAGEDVARSQEVTSDTPAPGGYTNMAESMLLAQVPRRTATEPTPKTAKPPNEHRYQPPAMSPVANPAKFHSSGFSAGPDYTGVGYDPKAQYKIYNKHTVHSVRPLLELGHPLYTEGPLGEGIDLIGNKNRLFPQFAVYGDLRTAIAYNDNGAAETGQIAARLNLQLDLKLTGTERLHAFIRPLDKGGKFTRYEFAGDNEGEDEFILDGNLETLYFEGDLGQIAAGLRDEYSSFDLPFAVGLMPLLFQNGIWMNDAILGGAFTLAAQNSPRFEISNMDTTFFAGFDDVKTQALKNAQSGLDEDAANIYGVATFIEVLRGYVEAGYAYTEDTRGLGFDYHNATLAFSRRYGGWLSNSVRLIANFGQNPDGNQARTADGVLLLVENSLITQKPYTLVPYFNVFAGFDRPQALALNAGGVLKNTGINFETDTLTGFPKLDDSARNTFGGALGVEYLFNLDQQIVVEAATVQPMDDPSESLAAGDQYGVGVRYQLPLTDSWILRADAMHGWLQNADDISGIRVEFRRKF